MSSLLCWQMHKWTQHTGETWIVCVNLTGLSFSEQPASVGPKVGSGHTRVPATGQQLF